MNKISFCEFQQGLALPVVLWIFLILSLMFSGYSYSVRTETAITKQMISSAKSRAAAEAGIQRAIAYLLSATENSEIQTLETEFHDQFGEIELTIAVQNESGRVDLNKAPEELLDIVLQGHVSSVEERERLLEGILQWRELRQPFYSLDQLSLVNGMTPLLMKKIRSLFTVYSGSTKLNPGLSTRSLLLPLADYSEAGINAFLETWQRGSLQEASMLLGNISTKLISKRVGNIYTIEVKASMNTETKTALSAVVKLVPEGNNPYTVLFWKEVESLALIH